MGSTAAVRLTSGPRRRWWSVPSPLPTEAARNRPLCMPARVAGPGGDQGTWQVGQESVLGKADYLLHRSSYDEFYRITELLTSCAPPTYGAGHSPGLLRRPARKSSPRRG